MPTKPKGIRKLRFAGTKPRTGIAPKAGETRDAYVARAKELPSKLAKGNGGFDYDAALAVALFRIERTGVMIDTETTGLAYPHDVAEHLTPRRIREEGLRQSDKPHGDVVVEIAATRVRDDETLFHSFVAPLADFHPQALAKTGFDISNLIGAPSWNEVFPALAARLANESPLVAWNSPFDHRAIWQTSRASGWCDEGEGIEIGTLVTRFEPGKETPRTEKELRAMATSWYAKKRRDDEEDVDESEILDEGVRFSGGGKPLYRPDERFVHEVRYGIGPIADAMEIVASLFGIRRGRGVDAMAKRFGIAPDPTQRHGALYDAKIQSAIIRAACDQLRKGKA